MHFLNPKHTHPWPPWYLWAAVPNTPVAQGITCDQVPASVRNATVGHVRFWKPTPSYFEAQIRITVKDSILCKGLAIYFQNWERILLNHFKTVHAMVNSSFSLALRKDTLAKRGSKTKLVRIGSDSFTFRPWLLYYRGSMWRKNEALKRNELPKVLKWTLVLICLLMLPFNPASLATPNTELGALAETKFDGCCRDGGKHSRLFQAHRLLVCGRAPGIDTAFHSHRQGVNSFALGTTADAHNSSSPALSNSEKQPMTPQPVSLPEGIAEHFLQSNILNPTNLIGMEGIWFCSSAFK